MTHGKGSLIGKMPGDDYAKFANLRALFGYMFAQSGKKLLFMGSEFGQWNEWYHETSLDWNLLEYPGHGGLQHWVQDLNAHPEGRAVPARTGQRPGGLRVGRRQRLPVERHQPHPEIDLGAAGAGRVQLHAGHPDELPGGRAVGRPLEGAAQQRRRIYGGSNQGNDGGVEAEALEMHGRPHSLNLTPAGPLGGVPHAAALSLDSEFCR